MIDVSVRLPIQAALRQRRTLFHLAALAIGWAGHIRISLEVLTRGDAVSYSTRWHAAAGCDFVYLTEIAGYSGVFV